MFIFLFRGFEFSKVELKSDFATIDIPAKVYDLHEESIKCAVDDKGMFS